jgi:transketolase
MKQNLRTAYGEALVEAGKCDPDIVVMDADLCKSTMSVLFEKEIPERFIEAGIAEQNMTSMAAGLAIGGKKPFIHSFAVFDTGRNFDQIRQSICLPKLNVTICGSSGGLSDFADGATHQSVEDVALMRVLPNMTVFVPCDAVQTKKMVKASLSIEGPVYIRINRMDLPVVYKEEDAFISGKAYVLREGTDFVVFAQGVMLHKALEAAEMLSKEGIAVRVVDVPTVKPLDAVQIKNLVQGMKGAVVAEEHSRIGGLYGAIAEILIEDATVRVKCVALNDVFGTSAENYEVLLAHYGLTADKIIEAVRAF